MPTDYGVERDWVVRAYYGHIQYRKRRRRNWPDPISATDYAGIPLPPNNPFTYYLFGECLVWLGSLNRDGYGTLTIDGEAELAHRAAYMQAARSRSLPNGEQINHKCNRPYCVQPAHLYAGTAQDNRDDAKMFRRLTWFSAAEKVMMFPDKDWPDDTLMHRIKSSRRDEVLAIWESPEFQRQAKMLDAPCPGHNFTIPVNPDKDSKACRICGMFELVEGLNSRFDIVAIAKEIYPVTQSVDRLLGVICESELAGDEYRLWRENVSSRCGILSLPRNGDEEHLSLRHCECLPCEQDRAKFRGKLQPFLTPFESEILDVCDRMEPAIRAAVDRARRNALATIARANGWTDDGVEALRAHLSSCVNSADEARKTIQIIEGALGFAIHAMQGTLQSFEDAGTFKYGMLPFIVKSYHSTDERHGVLLDEVHRTTEAIISEWTSEIREVRERYAVDTGEVAAHISEVARLFVISAVLEQLKFDCFSSNISTSQWPPVHQGCINGNFSRRETAFQSVI